MRGWIGVDLDGTLAHYDETSDCRSVGAPIPLMVARVKRWLAEGREVRIVTARVSPEWGDRFHQTTLIQCWCIEQLGVALTVQAHKDGSMVELWDDRAIGVVKNTGQTVTQALQASSETRDRVFRVLAETAKASIDDESFITNLIDAVLGIP